MGVVYKITSPTGRLYIGQAKNYEKRLGEYRRCEKYTYNSIVINSIKKHGFGLHLFEIVEEVENEKLSEREIFLIKELNTFWRDNPKGMNMTRGGECGSGEWKHDKERVEKHCKRITGEGNPFYGKKHSKEFKVRKSKEVSGYNKKVGHKVPEWGAEKGRNVVRKPVLCYNSNGDFVKEFTCGSSAAIEMRLWHTSISMVCNKKRTHVGGYVFRYKTENYPLKIDVGELKEQAVKTPVILIRRHQRNKTFPSAEEAAKFTGVPKTTIRRAARYNNGRPIRNGMIFIYKKQETAR